MFRSRELSPVELMQATIARIEAADPAVNALPIRFFDEAFAAARDAEARYAGRGPQQSRAPSKVCPWPSRTRSTSPASPAPRAR